MLDFLKKLFGAKEKATQQEVAPVIVEESKPVEPAVPQPEIVVKKPEAKKPRAKAKAPAQPKKTASNTRKPANAASKPKKVREPKA